jgi:hypothetical protein
MAAAVAACCLARGEGVQVRVRNYRKDGTAFWNDVVLTPVGGAASQQCKVPLWRLC